MTPSARFRRGRHVAFFLAGGAALAWLTTGRVGGSAVERREALVGALRTQGITAAAGDVRWLDGPGATEDAPDGAEGGKPRRRSAVTAALRGARAIVRALPAAGEAADLFLVETRLSPDGVLLDVGSIYNLTSTPAADEAAPVVRGELAAYVTTGLAAETTTVQVLDLGGQRSAMGGDWGRVERLQNAITNAQQTGQLGGVLRHSIAIEPAPKELAVAIEGRTIAIRADGREARVRLAAPGEAGASVSDVPWARVDTGEIARPGSMVTWAVDRVRTEIGDDAMQTIKAVAFTGLDLVLRSKEDLTGDTGEEGIASDLGKSDLGTPTQAMPVDTEIGWPPPPLETWVSPKLPGEGQWNPKDKDPFVRINEGLPAAFLTTFLRSDRTRKATRVYIALWDPRQIELHMMAGTVEPKGAAGEAGPGLIPRTPEMMKRVVAASNSGFQALHGEFGMMADGVVYLPPKPYAATLAVTRDGSTAFGTWPLAPAVPDDILSYRQNMTVMVEDEKWNPYGRTWWGGTPPGWADKTHTVRSGMCLTREHFVAYFYGDDISPEGLGQAMIQTRCKYGLALDMNAGHSGLEFYKVAPEAELEPLGRHLETSWEAEGNVSGLDGWRFRGRRFIRGMGLMNFPRYIRREARDFFYMTLRHVLPGPAVVAVPAGTPGSPAPAGVPPAAPGEGEWKLKGLPQHGFPYALALTHVRAEPARADVKVRLLKIDPRTVGASPAARATQRPTVAVLDPGAVDGAAPASVAGEAMAVWHSLAAFSVSPTAPVPDAVRIASGSTGGPGVAATCVHDEDGMLLYAELDSATPAGSASEGGGAAQAPRGDPASPVPSPTAEGGAMLDALLKRLGCSARVVLGRRLPIALGGDTGLGGEAMHPPAGPTAVRLTRADAAGGRRIFEDTPVVPMSTWYPLQQQRIRYFKKPKAEDPGAID